MMKKIVAFLIMLFCAMPVYAQPKEPQPEIKALLGFYQGEGENVIVREKDGQLEALYGVTPGDYPFYKSNVFQLVKNRYDDYTLNIANPRDYRGALNAKFERDSKGRGITCIIDKKRYTRIFFEGEDNNYLKITPPQDLNEMRENSLRAAMPPQGGGMQEAELIDVGKTYPDIKISMIYATENNFLSRPLYPLDRAFLHRAAADALQRVNRKLAAYGYGIVVWDAYRPWYLTKTVYDTLPENQKTLLESPDGGSPHNRGLSVDVTLYDVQTGKEVVMISRFDEASLRSNSLFQGGSELDRWRRDLLRLLMEGEGFSSVAHEWWHFDYKGFKDYKLLNTTFDSLIK